MENWRIILSLADQMFEEKKFEEAADMLQNFLFEEPGCAEVHNYLGWVTMFHLENPERGRMHFEFALLFDSTFAPAYLHMAEYWRSKGDTTARINCLSKALSCKNANAAHITWLIAETHELRGELGTASRLLKDALMLTTNSWEGDMISSSMRRIRRKRWMKVLPI